MAEAASVVSAVVPARRRDLGGLAVGRVLPSARRRMVGPFIFLDHMGPAELAPGQGIDVAPHPHIGLATVTYLFEGAILHRDSLGSVRRIEPGDLNWMTAGRGIVHSERTAEADRRSASALHGIQSWVALPRSEEDCKPDFEHYPKEDLPVFETQGARLRLVAGSAYGRQSPVRTRSPLFYVDALLEEGAVLALPEEQRERAAYLVEGAVEAEGSPLEERSLALFAEGGTPRLRALSRSRVMLLGGDPLEGERFIWWNFVASDRERIEAAKQDWREGRFPPVPGETDRIPLPAD